MLTTIIHHHLNLTQLLASIDLNTLDAILKVCYCITLTLIIILASCAYHRRCKKVDIDFLLKQSKSLYHHTAIDNLDNMLCNDGFYVIKGKCNNFANAINYYNIYSLVKSKPLIFFFLGEPTENQLWVNKTKSPYSLILNIEKCKGAMETSDLYFRNHDNAIIMVCNRLKLDESMVCLGPPQYAKFDIKAYLRFFFGKRV